jgi:mediator of RNA polymerase II transcription subunit 23
MYDVTKIITALKGKRGDHRVFRLAENVCLNLIFSLRDFFLVKRDGKVFALVSKLQLLC